MILSLASLLTLWLRGLQRTWAKNLRCLCGRIIVLSRASYQAGEGWYICLSSQVHEGHSQEVQDGRLESPVDTDEYDYSARRGQGRRAHGLEGVPEHDQLHLVLDGNKVGHPVFCMSVCLFSTVTQYFTSASHQVDHRVSSIHSWAWSLVLGVLFHFAIWFLRYRLCGVSSR
jgi:hypothetical protein